MSTNPKPSAVTPGSTPTGGPGTFEEAVEEVERIIDRIERGEVGLEESLREYERGVELIRRCRAVLQQAELKVEELTARMQSDGGESGES